MVITSLVMILNRFVLLVAVFMDISNFMDSISKFNFFLKWSWFFKIHAPPVTLKHCLILFWLLFLLLAFFLRSSLKGGRVVWFHSHNFNDLRCPMSGLHPSCWITYTMGSAHYPQQLKWFLSHCFLVTDIKYAFSGTLLALHLHECNTKMIFFN